MKNTIIFEEHPDKHYEELALCNVTNLKLRKSFAIGDMIKEERPLVYLT